MIQIKAQEPIDGLQLRAMVSQLNLFLGNIEQVSLEDSKWNTMRQEAINMKDAAEEMICLAKIKDGLDGPPVQTTNSLTSNED